MFQAWEAVLQATSWGSWAQFMASGMKVGSAPGYKVSNMHVELQARRHARPECIIQATSLQLSAGCACWAFCSGRVMAMRQSAPFRISLLSRSRLMPG